MLFFSESKENSKNKFMTQKLVFFNLLKEKTTSEPHSPYMYNSIVNILLFGTFYKNIIDIFKVMINQI